MAIKDISAVDELERIVRDDPTVLPEVNEQLDSRLASDELSERMDAGRALRAAANEDPELVAPYEETFVSFLSEESGSLRLSGAVGIAELASIEPKRVSGVAPQLVDVLEETVAPAIEEAVIRSLTRIGMADPEAVADADPVVAERLPDATLPTQTVITRSFVGVVREEPHLFDETIAAYATLIQSDPERTVRFAAEALADVASADPTALPPLESVLDRIEELEAHVDADPRPDAGTEIKAAARTLRSVKTA
ncbi:hypothetical protein [Natrinema salinisoli]|uniref:hypothetical protein n=1 Tax=Natrinema salinisoli TaxID=2878535 RepID=UPI001CF02880|nr:hypothetical protein [Natrinema salinisoli]